MIELLFLIGMQTVPMVTGVREVKMQESDRFWC